MEIWCRRQWKKQDGTAVCLAHLHEDRVLMCPYKNKEDRLRSEHQCSDYEECDDEVVYISGIKKWINRFYCSPVWLRICHEFLKKVHKRGGQ